MSGKIEISWGSRGRMYGRPNKSFYNNLWKKAKAKTHRSVSEAGYSYWDHVTNAASIAAFERDGDVDSLLSAEALPENASLVDFSTFAKDYPEKLFPLLSCLRPEFQEFFIEYYILHKPQSFIGRTHGCIQTRVWQALRIIEQTIGSLIILGTNPDYDTIHNILKREGLEQTQYGSLTDMIMYYVVSRNYAIVAKKMNAPTPAIRKIFRPSITKLLASKNVRAVAVGAYLRNLTHQVSLTKAGFSKRSIARTRRVKNLKFVAPPFEDSPLISFGAVSTLRDTPWCMLEISSDHRMTQISPMLKSYGKRLFGKRPAQIFAPVNADGELAFGYIFARCILPSLVRGLTHVRGISEMSSICNDEGSFVRAVTVPHEEVNHILPQNESLPSLNIRLGDYVEILTGDAARYCGTVTNTLSDRVTVEVRFPTDRKFTVRADASCLKVLPHTKIDDRTFWGSQS